MTKHTKTPYTIDFNRRLQILLNLLYSDKYKLPELKTSNYLVHITVLNSSTIRVSIISLNKKVRSKLTYKLIPSAQIIYIDKKEFTSQELAANAMKYIQPFL